MIKIGKVLALVALVVVLLFSSSCTNGTDDKRTAAPTTSARPNIVFILADDMRKDDLKYMPKTRSLLQDKGMSFSNAFVSNPLCCPSRATIMRGQYAHNTGVWTNLNSSDGGWQAYRQEGYEKDNVATRLHTAGYRIALFGKYLNYYAHTTIRPQDGTDGSPLSRPIPTTTSTTTPTTRATQGTTARARATTRPT